MKTLHTYNITHCITTFAYDVKYIAETIVWVWLCGQMRNTVNTLQNGEWLKWCNECRPMRKTTHIRQWFLCTAACWLNLNVLCVAACRGCNLGCGPVVETWQANQQPAGAWTGWDSSPQLLLRLYVSHLCLYSASVTFNTLYFVQNVLLICTKSSVIMRSTASFAPLCML